MSDDDGAELIISLALEGGVFANRVYAHVDVEYGTIDFARIEPTDPSVEILVARVTLPTSCILFLKRELQEVA